MFRTPIRNSLGNVLTANDMDLTFSTEKTPSEESPLTYSNELFLIADSESPKKKLEKILTVKDDQICLRAEIELLKNDIENEKQKNEDLSETVFQLEKNIKMLEGHLTEKKVEVRGLKRQVGEIMTEKVMQQNKLLAEIECFRNENAELCKQVEGMQYAEYQFSAMKQEITKMYKGKLQKFKEIMRERHEKYKLREAEFTRDKAKLSLELTFLLEKFSLLEKSIPALRRTSPIEVPEEIIFKPRENESKKSGLLEKFPGKGSLIFQGKENQIIF